jgi:cytochrome c553
MKRVLAGVVTVLLVAGMWMWWSWVELPAPPDMTHPVIAPWSAAGSSEGYPDGAEAYGSCASCHMADASGRPDGAIPRLAGQSSAVLAHKLRRLQRGETELPVMVPFARALGDEEIDGIARYLSTLPVPVGTPVSEPGRAAYGNSCAACHGPAGEGSDALLAPRLCGQHGGYLTRRVDEIVANTRGDADAAMAAVVSGLAPEVIVQIADFLQSGACGPEAP